MEDGRPPMMNQQGAGLGLKHQNLIEQSNRYILAKKKNKDNFVTLYTSY